VILAGSTESTGRKAARSQQRAEVVQRGSDMHIQMGPNKDTAVASYILHVRTKLKDGKITDEDNQESDVMFKRNGEWKVVFLHYSSAPKK